MRRAEFSSRYRPTEFSSSRTSRLSPLRTRINDAELRGRRGVEIPVYQRGEPRRLVRPERLTSNPQRERKKTNEGCVVRATASAAAKATRAEGARRVTPTEKEWQMRFDQIAKSNDNGPLKPTPSRAEVDSDIGELLSKYAKHDTPLGTALRDVKMEGYRDLSASQVKQLIGSGRQVMVIGRTRDAETGEVSEQRHMVHLTERHGKLVAESDGGKRVVTLNKDGAYNVYP